MGSTNKTTNLELPQWQTTEKLEMADLNDAFNKVDGAVIVESGSNAQGSYVKWGDGTMECYNYSALGSAAVSIPATTTEGFTWTYPKPFISTPAVFLEKAVSSNNAYLVDAGLNYNNTGNTSAGIGVRNTYTEAIVVRVGARAIGRWK